MPARWTRVTVAIVDKRFLDKRVALESALKACQLTQNKDPFCLQVLAVAHSLAGDYDAAIATIDNAIALLKPGDKRLAEYQSIRQTFQGNLVGKLGVEQFLERLATTQEARAARRERSSRPRPPLKSRFSPIVRILKERKP